MNKITIKELEETFDTKFGEFVKNEINKLDLSYYAVEQTERDMVLKQMIEVLLDPLAKRSGEHRIKDWEKGWGENRDSFRKQDTFSNLVPKYFGKYPYIRWKQKFIKGVDNELEYNLVKVLQLWLFDMHLSNVDSIYEFGCGTGHNLLRARDINKKAKIYGLDWTKASQETIQQINKTYDKKFIGKQFNFFQPDVSYNLDRGSGVYTFAALEQTSDKFKSFIDYLVIQKPKICLHIEPMWEYLDSSSLMDYLSIRYFKKRNYLNGLKKYLLELEAQGKIEIVQDQRSYIGSMFVDGYSIIAWRVKNA
jgi:hypothetical protein